MKRSLISIFLTFFFVTQVFSQDKKDLKISLATGIFNSTHYTNAKSRQFYNLGFDYSVTKRHLICADYISGQYRYYDNVRVTTPIPLTTPGYGNHTNAEARTTVFSVMYKYKFLNDKSFAISIGSGLGIVTETYNYPVDIPNGGFTFETSGGKGDLCFPLRLDLDYKISRHFQTGIIAGAYVYPDYPFVGQHLGLRFSYILK